MPRCTACGEYHWYPRSFCPFCHGHDLEWPQASGAGTIYSFSIMRRAEVPYVVAFVTLAEGPGMMTNIVGCSPGAVKIGLPVCLAFSTSAEGEPFPVFTLA